MAFPSWSRRVLMVAAVTALVACGGGSSPSTPGTVPTPTPSVTPSSSPTAPPGTLPAGAACGVGPGTLDSTCGRQIAQLDSNVEAAIETVAKAHPEIFDVNDQQGPGGYLVKN